MCVCVRERQRETERALLVTAQAQHNNLYSVYEKLREEGEEAGQGLSLPSHPAMGHP